MQIPISYKYMEFAGNIIIKENEYQVETHFSVRNDYYEDLLIEMESNRQTWVEKYGLDLEVYDVLKINDVEWMIIKLNLDDNEYIRAISKINNDYVLGVECTFVYQDNDNYNDYKNYEELMQRFGIIAKSISEI